MKIELSMQVYEWLQCLQILPPVNYSNETVQLQTNDQIYLDNGYLIAVLLKKLVVPYSKQYETLLKVRKITVLQTDENWMYIKSVLNSIGFAIDPYDQVDQILILEILDYLYQQYAPLQLQKKVMKRRRATYQFDIVNFDSAKGYLQSKNLLQFMCLLLCSTLHISLSEALGMLFQNCRWLKKLIKFGSQKNQFGEVIQLYDNLHSNYQLFEQLITLEPIHFKEFIEPFSHGIFSQSEQVCEKTLQLYRKLKDTQWMKEIGFRKLLLSQNKSVFNFLLAAAYPENKQIFDENLPSLFPNKDRFLKFVFRLIKNLPKHIYGRQIIEAVSFDFLIERALELLDPQEEKIEIYTRQLARNVLSSSIQHYYHRISPVNLKRILSMGFQFQNRFNLRQSFSLLSSLFDIVEYLIINKLQDTERFFKTALSYLQLGANQVQQFTLCNLINIYSRLKQYFPLKCLLSLYPYKNRTAQSQDYVLFQMIAIDSSVQPEQVQLVLNICYEFYTTQLQSQCFINIMSMFLRKSPINWSSKHLEQIFTLWRAAHPQALNKSDRVLPPKKKTTKQQFGSIGVRRKQMVKTKSYQIYCALLRELVYVQNKKFLQQFLRLTKKTLSQIQKDPEKAISKHFLKDLEKKISFAASNARNLETAFGLMSKICPKQSTVSRRILNQEQGTQRAKIEPNSLVTLPRNSRLMNISQAISEQLEEQKNQFMTNTVYEKSKQQPNYNPLLPFEQFGQLTNDVMYYSKDLLEQHEIIYLDMLYRQYDQLIQDCSCLNLHCNGNINRFLKLLELDKLTPKEESQYLWLKSSAEHNENKASVRQFLFQLAMLLFSFEKNRPASITCVQSFLKKVQKTISKQQINAIVQAAKVKTGKQKERTKEYQMLKSIEFTNQISGKLSNIKEDYLIASQVLNSIFKSSLGINLLEFTSRIVNKVFTPSLDQQREENPVIQYQNQQQEFLSHELQDNFEQKKPNSRNLIRVNRKAKMNSSKKLVQSMHQDYLKASLASMAVQQNKNNAIKELVHKNKQDLQKQLRQIRQKQQQSKSATPNIQQQQQPSKAQIGQQEGPHKQQRNKKQF